MSTPHLVSAAMNLCWQAPYGQLVLIVCFIYLFIYSLIDLAHHWSST